LKSYLRSKRGIKLSVDESSIIKSIWTIVKQPTIVKIHKGILNANSINEVINQIKFPYTNQSSLIIDLQNLVSINAVGLLGLVLILIELLREGTSILIYRPTNQYLDNLLLAKDIQHIEELSDLSKASNSKIIWWPQNIPVNTKTNYHEKTILQIIYLQDKNDTNKLLHFLWDNLIDELKFEREVASAFCQVVSELFDNIIQHSDSPIIGFASIELQLDKNPPRVIVALGDIGKGIKQSLEEAGLPFRGSSDCAAIQKAVIEGASSKKTDNRGRGGGLTRCREHADAHGCIFAIRSGKGYYIYKVEKPGSSAADLREVSWFPGTQAYFGLYGKDT
jgi:hypothetical protein